MMSKKVVFPFVEIEVPDDCPSGLDPQSVFEYMGNHPEVADRIVREYRKAYRKWINSKGSIYGTTTFEQKQATTRSQVENPDLIGEVSAPIGS